MQEDMYLLVTTPTGSFKKLMSVRGKGDREITRTAWYIVTLYTKYLLKY